MENADAHARQVEECSAAQSPASLKLWRAVEAQHVVSTLRLTGNDPDAQDLLERLIEESKPPLPVEAAGLDYLLATPFRYPPRTHGSRFRAITDPGVLYGGMERRTACAEMGYWRWRFVTDSDGLKEIAAAPQTLFQSGARGLAVNLQQPPFHHRESEWTRPNDYGPTQAIGRAAREAGAALILYRSVRDPEPGVCIAVLHPGALRPRRPLAQETWHLTVTPGGAIWQRQSNRFHFRFT
ncbi:MAG TPA: RES family NAD+ phosphorylase [Bryobacteraceae bacterium]|nr:RES family NAD+ phosphorylase [Bryobacteraceae bacterium]